MPLPTPPSHSPYPLPPKLYIGLFNSSEYVNSNPIAVVCSNIPFVGCAPRRMGKYLEVY